ncbi:hypothetical protein SUGI_1193020 [Cryptomeria japonica]|nr:hypothetical protein SUGI_1193020 [Cryptomeria japonica]
MAGSWHCIGGYCRLVYVILQLDNWILDFNPNNMKSLKIDRPVLIPNLPVELMDIEIIRKIGNHIGKFVEISDKYRNYANCVMIINMDISVKTLKPIEIKSGVSSFLIYPEFFKGIPDLDPAPTPVLPPSQLRSSRIPGVDISFNLEKGGFVVEEIPLPSRHIEGTKDAVDIEEGEFIINKGHEDYMIPLGISIDVKLFPSRQPLVKDLCPLIKDKGSEHEQPTTQDKDIEESGGVKEYSPS